MKNSKVFSRAEELIKQEKYNSNSNKVFYKALQKFISDYATFDALTVTENDIGSSLIITISVKNFKNNF